MVSYDPRKMEMVSQFAAFMEALANPEALKKQLDEMKAAVAELKEYSKRKNIGENVDEYIAKAEKDATVIRDAANANADAMAKASQSLLEDAKVTRAAADAELKTASEAKYEAQKLQQAAKAAEYKAKELLASAEQKGVELAQLQKELQEQKAALDTKAESLKALLG